MVENYHFFGISYISGFINGQTKSLKSQIASDSGDVVTKRSLFTSVYQPWIQVTDI